MELRDFIENTLISIKEGVRGANQGLAKSLGENPDSLYFTMHASKTHSINFDVAVTVSNEEGKSKSGGGKLNISVVSIGAEAGSEKKQMQTNISRIKFDITPRTEIY